MSRTALEEMKPGDHAGILVNKIYNLQVSLYRCHRRKTFGEKMPVELGRAFQAIGIARKYLKENFKISEEKMPETI